MSIKVLKPGLATSVQDAGREGHYHLGIPPSGALDQYALRAANLLVGNAPTAAVLECALLGPQLEFQRDALVAVCGARMTPRLEGAEMPLDTSFRVRAGQVLGFDFIRAGARGYLAIDGGIAVPEVLGSRSTYGLGAIGGLQGRRLAEGDLLPLGPASPSAVEGLALPRSLQVEVGGEVSLRVVPGLYVHRLTPTRSSVSSPRPGPSARRRTAPATASRAARRSGSSRANSHSAQARTRPTSSTPAIPSARSRYRAGSNPSSCIAMRCPVGICHAGHGDQPRPEPAGADATEPEGAFRRRQPGGRSRGASPLQLASATTPALLPALSRRYRPLPSAKRPPAHL